MAIKYFQIIMEYCGFKNQAFLATSSYCDNTATVMSQYCRNIFILVRFPVWEEIWFEEFQDMSP